MGPVSVGVKVKETPIEILHLSGILRRRVVG